MRKILWHSNAPYAPTGYGQQTGLFAPHIAEHYDLAISCFYGLDGAKLVWRSIPLFPGIGADFGNAYLLRHAEEHFGSAKGGVVFTLMDVWPLDREMLNQMNVACWTPIDHEPIPFGVANVFQATNAVPVAMSRFGEQQLRAVNLDPLYVPHGVDTSVFKPLDKARIRKETGVPESAFLVGMVAANKGRSPSRKGFQQAFEAFRIFREKHSEAMLYLHTVVDPDYAGGEDLLNMARQLGIADALVVAPQYALICDPLPPSAMAQIYNGLDVLLNPSMGEGFGIPVLEAAACGVPSIVTNFTAMPEVAGDGGWKVGCRPWWTPGKSWMAVADVEDIVHALTSCYGQSEKQRQRRSQTVRDHALDYDVKKVLEEHFLPALETVFERVAERKPTVEKVAA